MSYRASLGTRTIPKPDGSTWTGEIVATDEHGGGPLGPAEGLEFADGGFATLVEAWAVLATGAHPKYVEGVTHAERVTLTPDFSTGRITVEFDGTPIGVCQG